MPSELRKPDEASVEIKRYYNLYHFKDLVLMHRLQESRIADILEEETVPAYGWIAYNGSIPVAAGFLRLIEGGYAQIDTLVSNPTTPSVVRHKAISQIVNNCVEDARWMRLKGIVSYTRDESVLKRAIAIGFQAMPDIVISLNLGA